MLFESTTAQVTEDWRESEKDELYGLRSIPMIIPIRLRKEGYMGMKHVCPKVQGREKWEVK